MLAIHFFAVKMYFRKLKLGDLKNMLQHKQIKAFKKLFKTLRVLKLETIIYPDIHPNNPEYHASILTLYISRLISLCEAAFLLYLNELYAEAEVLIRSGFEVNLLLHYLINNPSKIRKCKEHSLIQRYINLLVIKEKSLCSPAKIKEFKQDLVKTRKNIRKLKHYEVTQKDINDCKRLIRLIGSSPFKVGDIIAYIKQLEGQEANHFKHALCGYNIDSLHILLYGGGSTQTHCHFDRVVNVSLSPEEDTDFYIHALMYSAIFAIEICNSLDLNKMNKIKKYLVDATPFTSNKIDETEDLEIMKYAVFLD